MLCGTETPIICKEGDVMGQKEVCKIQIKGVENKHFQ